MMWILLCLCLLYTVAGEEYSCSNIASSKNFTLNNCNFEKQDDDVNAIRCDVIAVVRNTWNRDYGLEYKLHYKLLFRPVGTPDNPASCLGLSSLLIDGASNRMYFSNSTILDLYADISALFDFFWKSVTYGYAKSDFDHTIPVAIFENTCEESNQKDGLCTSDFGVKMLLDVIRPEKEFDAHRDNNSTFWKAMHKKYAELRGFNTHLHLQLDSEVIEVINPKFIHAALQDMDVVYLKISGGKWKELKVPLLNYMENLKTLDLSNNRLEKIGLGYFFNMSLLEEFILADNFFENLPMHVGRFRLLKHFDISNNPIRTRNDVMRFLQHYTNLKFLNLAGIKLNDLSTLRHLLATCDNNNGFQLDTLNISNCDIRQLQSDDFQCQKSLRILDVSYNKIKEIPSEIFSVHDGLQYINMSNNVISGPKLKLGGEVKLLDMSDNFIDTNGLNNTILSGNVEMLDLSRNIITSWTNEEVIVENVKHLNLSYNRILSISEQMSKTFSGLESVDLCLYCKGERGRK